MGAQNRGAVAATTFRVRTVRADVILGQPQANCRFHGICRIDGNGVPGPVGCRGPRLTGRLSWTGPGRCALTVPRGQLTAQRELYHFGEGEVRLHRAQPLGRLFPVAGPSVWLPAQTCLIAIGSLEYVIRMRVSERARAQDAG